MEEDLAGRMNLHLKEGIVVSKAVNPDMYLLCFTVTQMLSANQSTRYCNRIPRFSHHISMYGVTPSTLVFLLPMYLEYSMNDYRDCCMHLEMTAHISDTILTSTSFNSPRKLSIHLHSDSPSRGYEL